MTTTTPPQQATNGELIRWSFERINDHDVAPLKEFWTEDTVEHFPDRTCRGAEEIAAYFEDTFRGSPTSGWRSSRSPSRATTSSSSGT